MGINTHGFQMVGLGEAEKVTREWCNGSDCYVQIAYDRSDGEIMTSCHCDFAHNSFTRYDDGSIVVARTTPNAMSAQKIADAVADAIQRRECLRQFEMASY